jgi:hypothetical protein
MKARKANGKTGDARRKKEIKMNVPSPCVYPLRNTLSSRPFCDIECDWHS